MRFHYRRGDTAALFETEHDPYCHFGIISGPLLGASLSSLFGGGIFGGLAAGALEGAAGGALLSGITGGNPLTGALTGGLTGGVVGGFGGPLGNALGIGTTGGDILAGTLSGAAGSALTGGNTLTGALEGGAGGALAGLTSGTPSTSTGTGVTGAPATGTGGGTSAASTAGITPGGAAGAAGGTAVDLTAPTDVFGLSAPGDTLGAGGGTFSPATPATTYQPSFTPAATAPAAGTGSGGFSSIFNKIASNPAEVLGIAGLGASLLMGPPSLPAEKQLQQAAGEAGTQARTLAAYQESGTLPPGLQSIVDQQVNAARSAIVSQYGQEGLANSTMMVDKLNQLKQQKSAEIAQFADNLAKQGIQWQSLSDQELGQLLQAQEYSNTSFTNALTSFARGLAGGGFGATTYSLTPTNT